MLERSSQDWSTTLGAPSNQSAFLTIHSGRGGACSFITAAILHLASDKSGPGTGAHGAVPEQETVERQKAGCRYLTLPGSLSRHLYISYWTNFWPRRRRVSPVPAEFETPDSCGMRSARQKHRETPAARYAGRPRWFF